MERTSTNELRFTLYKEITSEYSLAFIKGDNSLSNGVAVVRIEDSGEIMQITPPIFSPTFFEVFIHRDRICGNTTFYHLHCTRDVMGNGDWRLYCMDNRDWDYGSSADAYYGSFLFQNDFSSAVRFELILDSISSEENGILTGKIGHMAFKGHICIYNGSDNTESIIPIKYKRIVLGNHYAAAFDGQEWDIYDDSHMDDNSVHYVEEKQFGDTELSLKGEKHYHCTIPLSPTLSADNKNARRLLFRRVMLKSRSVLEGLDEPYPLTNTGKIKMIGFPRDPAKENEFDKVTLSPFKSSHFALNHDCYFCIVEQNGKKGLWSNEARIDKTIRTNNEVGCSYRGHGNLILSCDYYEIKALAENVRLYFRKGTPISYSRCNSFAFLSESGWGVFDGVKERTIVTPVLDEPAIIITGREGYICRFKGKYGIIDENGNQFLPFVYDDVAVSVKVVDDRVDPDIVEWIIITDVDCYLNGQESHYSYKYNCGVR